MRESLSQPTVCSIRFHRTCMLFFFSASRVHLVSITQHIALRPPTPEHVSSSFLGREIILFFLRIRVSSLLRETISSLIHSWVNLSRGIAADTAHDLSCSHRERCKEQFSRRLIKDIVWRIEACAHQPKLKYRVQKYEYAIFPHIV